MIKELCLKNVKIPNNLILAPLAGYTDAAMRRLCREAGAGLTVTEMVSVKGLLYGSKNTAELLTLADNESPSCVQLFGSDASVFSEVIANNPLLSPFDIIDINMGCPVKKIVSSGDGSALVADTQKAASIVKAAVAATNKPVTVKVRIPSVKEKIFELIKALIGSGASMISIHGRTREQMYGGSADWEIIEKCAQNSTIPIIGNGDILTVNDAKNRLSSAVSGIMIGRGAIGNPQIFSDILEYFSSKQLAQAPQDALATNDKKTPQDTSIIEDIRSVSIKETAKRHINYCVQYFGEKYTVTNMRKHLAYYVKGLANMREFKSQINQAPTTTALLSLIEEHLKD